MPNLETTNWLLGAIAVASLVQTAMLVAAAVASRRMVRQVSARVDDIERNVLPLRRQVDSILTDVQAITPASTSRPSASTTPSAARSIASTKPPSG
jgi:hypothetical protein